MLKKLFAVLLALLITASCFTFYSYAAHILKVTASASEAKAGENVTLTLTLSDLPAGNVNLIHFKVTYDTNTFSLNGVKNKEAAFTGSTIPSDIEITAIAEGNTLDVYLINWNRIEGTGNSSFAASQKLEYTFTTKSDAEGRNFTFSLSEVEYGFDYKILVAERISGSGVNAVGKVAGKTVFARGDLNEDGSKNTFDAIYLLRHIMRPGSYPIEQSGDMDGDGNVSTADAIYLLRHMMRSDKYPLAD